MNLKMLNPQRELQSLVGRDARFIRLSNSVILDAMPEKPDGLITEIAHVHKADHPALYHALCGADERCHTDGGVVSIGYRDHCGYDLELVYRGPVNKDGECLRYEVAGIYHDELNDEVRLIPPLADRSPQRQAVLVTERRAKMLEYAKQDRLDADYFDFIGKPDKAEAFRKRATMFENWPGI